jgi:hypothetical protein
MPVAQQQVGKAAPSASLSPGSGGSKLLSEIRIEHGPIQRLGRFFLEADRAARERDVFLSFCPLHELVAVNQQNRDTWRPLIPIFDPHEGGFRPETGFCILGRNRHGEVVAAQAARLYTFDETSFYDAATSLALFYSDTAAARSRGEVCAVSAQSARGVTGRVVFSGGGWYRPDYRGRLLSCILPRISRAYAFTRWDSDFTVSMMAEGVIKGGMASRCGYTNVDWDVTIRNFAIGDLRFAFVWMTAEQLLDDLDTFLGGFAAQIDGPIEQRRAKQ